MGVDLSLLESTTAVSEAYDPLVVSVLEVIPLPESTTPVSEKLADSESS
jgi:hypothetical protein